MIAKCPHCHHKVDLGTRVGGKLGLAAAGAMLGAGGLSAAIQWSVRQSFDIVGRDIGAAPYRGERRPPSGPTQFAETTPKVVRVRTRNPPQRHLPVARCANWSDHRVDQNSSGGSSQAGEAGSRK